MAAAGEALAPAARPPEALYRKLSPGPGKSAAEVASHQRARIHGAMIEIAGERGYRAVTVRELAQLAGVSTRAFYEHFEGKEECFLSAHELVVRHIAAAGVAAQNGERDWQERLRLAFAAFAQELEVNPRASRVALVEPFAVGPAGLERMRRTEGIFEAMISESFSRSPDEIDIPPLLIKGIITGAERVARGRVLADRESDLPRLAGKVHEWALCFHDGATEKLEELDRRATLLLANAAIPREASTKADDDRMRILVAAAKLAGSDGYAELTVPRIRVAAGVSRRSFNSYFEGVEDCFIAALERKIAVAFDCAADAREAGSSWAGGVYRAIATLCVKIARDPLLAKLAFSEIFAPGLNGVHCRERLAQATVALLRSEAADSERPSALAAEASIGAIWGVMHHHVISGRAKQLPWLAATLSYLALAPAVGPSATTDAIRVEQIDQ